VHAGKEDHVQPGWTTSRCGTGLTMEESIRMAENRDKWRKYVHGLANPRVEDG